MHGKAHISDNYPSKRRKHEKKEMPHTKFHLPDHARDSLQDPLHMQNPNSSVNPALMIQPH